MKKLGGGAEKRFFYLGFDIIREMSLIGFVLPVAIDHIESTCDDILSASGSLETDRYFSVPERANIDFASI